jgi:hypothetical protein
MKNKTNALMAELAAHLGNQRKAILKRWRKATEEGPGVTIASSLTRVQFNDHIPGFWMHSAGSCRHGQAV